MAGEGGDTDSWSLTGLQRQSCSQWQRNPKRGFKLTSSQAKELSTCPLPCTHPIIRADASGDCFSSFPESNDHSQSPMLRDGIKLRRRCISEEKAILKDEPGKSTPETHTRSKVELLKKEESFQEASVVQKLGCRNMTWEAQGRISSLLAQRLWSRQSYTFSPTNLTGLL